MNTKVKKEIIVRQSQYTTLYVNLLYLITFFAVVFTAFLMAEYIISYSIQMQMLNNKLWSIKTEEILLDQQIHDINTEINKLYFNNSSVIYIGDKAFSIFKSYK